MPHILVRVHGYYAVWSTVVDAPLTPFVATVDDRRAVAPSGEDFSPERLARLERTGRACWSRSPEKRSWRSIAPVQTSRA